MAPDTAARQRIDETSRPAAVPLEARGISHQYSNGGRVEPVLYNVDLVLQKGTFTAIMGPSGSGKSTLLNIVAGLEQPTAGEVLIGGVSTTGLSDDQLTDLRRDRIGFVFQASILLPELRVRQNTELPARLARQPLPTTRIQAVTAELGIGDHLDALPATLSGGQAQRVAAARAIVQQPAVIVADEPTGALDVHTGATLLSIMRRAVDHEGQTVLMVTHDPAAAARADRVILLVDGKIIDELAQPSREVLADRLAHQGR